MAEDLLRNWDQRDNPVPARDLLPRLRQVGSPGLMGTVHAVADVQPPCYYKQYHEPELHTDRLARLIAWRQGLGGRDLGLLEDHCAWPVVTVAAESGQPTGFLMRPAPPEFWFEPVGPLGRARERHTLELSHLMLPVQAQAHGITAPQHWQRLELLQDLATIFDLFRRNEIVYGDVSGDNVLWTLVPRPRIYLIDCDNARPADLPAEQAGVAMSSMHAIWRDPALPQHGSPGMESDRFALAMFCYRVYYQAPSALSFGEDGPELDLPPDAHVLPLQRVLELGLSRNPAQRPPAADWIKATVATRVVLSRQAEEVAHAPATAAKVRLARVPDWVRPRASPAWIVLAVGLLAVVVFLVV